MSRAVLLLMFATLFAVSMQQTFTYQNPVNQTVFPSPYTIEYHPGNGVGNRFPLEICGAQAMWSAINSCYNPNNDACYGNNGNYHLQNSASISFGFTQDFGISNSGIITSGFTLEIDFAAGYYDTLPEYTAFSQQYYRHFASPVFYAILYDSNNNQVESHYLILEQPCNTFNKTGDRCTKPVTTIFQPISCTTAQFSFSTMWQTHYHVQIYVYNDESKAGVLFVAIDTNQYQSHAIQDILVSKIRFIANVQCAAQTVFQQLYYFGGLEVDTTVLNEIHWLHYDGYSAPPYFFSHHPQDKYLEGYSSTWREGNYRQCSVCPSVTGSIICLDDLYSEDQTSLVKQQTIFDNLANQGLKVVGGVLILRGAIVDGDVLISLTVNGHTWIPYKAADLSNPSISNADGSFIPFCGNCMYNTWAFESVEGYLYGANNTFRLYGGGSRGICLVSGQIIFFTEDIQPPSVTCTTANSLTASVDGNLYPISSLQLIASSSDNCYSSTSLHSYTVSPSNVSIWDYPSTTVTASITDNSGNTGSCTTTINIQGIYNNGNLWTMGFITYPSEGSQVPANDILIQWGNYAPTIDDRTTVTIILYDSTSQVSHTLVSGYPYGSFQYQYEGPLIVNSSDSYTIYVTLTRFDGHTITDHVNVTFFQKKGHFY